MFNSEKVGLFKAVSWLIRDVTLRLMSEDYVLGCDLTRIEGDGSVNICLPIEKSFTPRQLIIPSHVAPSVLITRFSVDDCNLFVSTGAIPGEAFLALLQPRLKMSPVQKDSWITLGVTNLFHFPIDFSAAIIGTAL